MNRIQIFLISTVLFSNFAFAESYRIDDSNALYLYESRADIKTPEEKIASFMSVEYRRARDEFTRRDLFNEIKPVLDKRLKEALSIDSVSLYVNSKLGKYDFNRNAFKTGFTENTYIAYDNGYGVIFKNAKSIEYLSVPLNHARSLADALGSSRYASFHIEAKISSVKEDPINYKTGKIIVLNITSMSATLKSGELVGAISF